MSLKIGCIVEGQGDVAAVPVLIRRIAAECYPEMAIHIPRPIRVNRNQVVLPDQLEQEVELAARRIDGNGAIFIILDSDDDCPVQINNTSFNQNSTRPKPANTLDFSVDLWHNR